MAKLLFFLFAVQLCALVIGTEAPPTKEKDKVIVKYPIALPKKSTQIAQHAASLRKISHVLSQHAKIAPLKKGLALDKLAHMVKRMADTKDRIAATIVKKTLPQSMAGLRALKNNASPSMKALIKRLIKKTKHINRFAADKLLHREANVNHKRAVQVAKQVTKILKTMKAKGFVISTKRAARMVKQTLSPGKGQTAVAPTLRKLCGKQTKRQQKKLMKQFLQQLKRYLAKTTVQKGHINGAKELAIVKKTMHG